MSRDTHQWRQIKGEGNPIRQAEDEMGDIWLEYLQGLVSGLEAQSPSPLFTLPTCISSLEAHSHFQEGGLFWARNFPLPALLKVSSHGHAERPPPSQASTNLAGVLRNRARPCCAEGCHTTVTECSPTSSHEGSSWEPTTSSQVFME